MAVPCPGLKEMFNATRGTKPFRIMEYTYVRYVTSITVKLTASRVQDNCIHCPGFLCRNGHYIKPPNTLLNSIPFGHKIILQTNSFRM
jgi:hypothetical protein